VKERSETKHKICLHQSAEASLDNIFNELVPRFIPS